MASFPTSVFAKADIANGATSDAADVNDAYHEITALEDGYLNGTARLNSSNTTINGTAAFSTGFTERGRSVRAGEWSTFTAVLTASSGTVQAGTQVNAFTLLGKSLIYAFNIVSTLSAGNASLSINLPSTYVASQVVVTPFRMQENGSNSIGFCFSNSTAVSFSKVGADFSSGTVVLQGIITIPING